ncbi:MAG: DUF2382 domain-containing protein [Gemmatimonadaceae bacterium]
MADERNTRNEPGDAARTTPRVAPLSDLGAFQVADGFPDPRGWDVIASDGMKVGKVHELIVDTGTMRTRYLDIRLDTDIAGDGDDRDVLLPSGAARLDDRDDHLVLDSMTTAQIAALPVYAHGDITREYENSVLSSMPGGMPGSVAAGATRATAPAAPPNTPSADDDYYSSHHFDDSRFSARGGTAEQSADTTRLIRSEEELTIGKRQVRSGEIDVHKTVETEHVQRPVTLTREEVTIERRPVSAERIASGDMGIQETDDEIRIPVIEEEVVMETRSVVKEEIIIRKHDVTEEKIVEADLRKERIDIDNNSTTTQQGHQNDRT